jgi:hypothetical protein
MKASVATIERGDRRARPQTPMTAGAAIAPDGSEADEQPGADHQPKVPRDRLRDGRVGRSAHRERCRDETQYEGQPSVKAVVSVGWQQARDDPADSGDPAVRGHQQHRRRPDQGAADERGNRGESRHRRTWTPPIARAPTRRREALRCRPEGRGRASVMRSCRCLRRATASCSTPPCRRAGQSPCESRRSRVWAPPLPSASGCGRPRPIRAP